MNRRGKIVTLILTAVLLALSGAKGVFADDNYTPAGINGKNWMKYIPDYAPISSINIPGSHDAATKHLWLPGAVLWLNTQNESIEDQLDFGVRLLDIRIDSAVWFDDMIICHGPADCYRTVVSPYYLSDLVKDCKTFLKKNSTETVLISLQQETDKRSVDQEKYDKVWEMFLESFEKDSDIIYLTKDSTMPTLGECRGKTVIFQSNCYKKTEDHDTVKEKDKIGFLETVWKASKPQDYETVSSFYKSPTDTDYSSVPLVVFSSCRDGSAGIPINSYKDVHKFIRGEYSSTQYKFVQGNYYGWCFNNYSNESVTKAIYLRNRFIDPDKQDNEKIYWGHDSINKILTFSTRKTADTPNSIYRVNRFASFENLPWYRKRLNTYEVHSLDTVSPKYMDNWFNDFRYLVKVDADIDSSNLVSMNNTFLNCRELKTVINSKFINTSNLEKCDNLFCNDSELTSVFVGDSSVSFVEAAKKSQDVFKGCSKLTGSFGTKISGSSNPNSLARVDSANEYAKGVLSYLDPYGVYWGIDNDKLLISKYYKEETPTKYIKDGNDNPNWYAYREKIKSVSVIEEINPTDTINWFRGMKNATDFDLELLDTSNITSMKGMFDECNSVKELDLSGFYSTKLTRASYMFYNCANLETIYTNSAFMLPEGNNSEDAFKYCINLVGGQYTKYDEHIIDGTRGRGDRAISDGVAGYFTEPVEFYWGFSDNTLYLSTGKKDKTPNKFLDRYTKDTQPWDVHRGAIERVEILNKMSPKYMCSWFAYLYNLHSIDLSKIDTSNTISLYRCFMNSGIRILDISNFICENLKNVHQCFSGMESLTTIYANSDFDLRGLTDSQHVFWFSRSLVGGKGTVDDLDFLESEEDVKLAVCDGKDGAPGLFTEKEKPTDNNMYWGIKNRTLYIDNKPTELCPSLLYDSLMTFVWAPWYFQRHDIEKVEVLNMISPVYTYAWFYGLDNATEFDLSKMDTSHTINMSEMFYGVKSCKVLDISNFSRDSLVHADDMFTGCENLTTIYVDKSFDLRDMGGVKMFSNCNNLVGGCGTSFAEYGNVTSDFAVWDDIDQEGYFTENCEFFWGVEQTGPSSGYLYISSEKSAKTPNKAKNRPYDEDNPAPWIAEAEHISMVSVLNEVSFKYMDGLFEGLSRAETFDLSKIDTSKVKTMDRLFKGCSSVENLYINYFVNGGITSANEMFAGCTSLKSIYANPYFYLTYPDVSAESIFDGCSNLTGGKGTQFNPYIQKERACVDDTPFEPGYFTSQLRYMGDGVDAWGYEGDYDGQPHMITVQLSGAAQGASVYYSLTEGTYGSRIAPEIIDEGEYTVYYRVVQYGYEDVTGSAKVKINPLELSDADVECPSPCDFMYDGQYHTFDITLKNAAEGAYIDYECSTSPEKEETLGGQIMPFWSKAGEYDITVIVVKDHYKEYRKTIKLVIAPKEFNPADIKATGYSGEYDGKYHTIQIELSKEAEGATVYYAKEGSSDYSTIPVVCRDVDESVKVKYKITKENYKDYFGECDISISPLELKAEDLILQKSEYAKSPSDGTPVEVLYRVVCGNSVLIKDTGDGGDYIVKSGESATDEGTYTLVIEGEGNYSGEISANWEIVLKSLNDYLDIEEVHTAYDAQEHTINITVLSGISDCTLSYAEFPDTNYSQDKPRYTDAGVHVIRYRAETNDETFDPEDRCVEGTAVVEITPCELEDDNLAITPLTCVYNEKSHIVDYGVMSPIDGTLLKEDLDYEIVSATTEATDVGEYLIAVNGKGNYSGYASGKWEIVPGDMSSGITVEGCEKEYDKKGHSITVKLEGAAIGAKVLYSTDGSTYTYENPDFTEIGTYTVRYKISKKGYEDVSGSETVTIKPIELKEDNVLLISSYNIYSGSEIEPRVYVYYDNRELTEGIDYEVSGDRAATDVGYYSMNVAGKGDFSGNIDIKWMIAGDDEPVIEYDIYSGEYDGQPHASYLVIPDSLKGKVTVTYGLSSESCTDDEPVMQTDAGLFMYWAKVTFNDGSISPFITELFGVIKQRIVTVSANNKSKTKGKSDPELTYSVDRLISGDRIDGVIVYRDPGEEVGKYVINVEVDPTQNSNYYVQTQAGIFTIKKPKKDDPQKDDPKKDDPWKDIPWDGPCPYYPTNPDPGSSSSDNSSGARICTVSFDVNGGYYVSPRSVAEGDIIDFSGITTFRANSEFTGWYLDKELKNRVLQLQVAGDTTVYAGWRIVSPNPPKTSASAGTVQQTVKNKTSGGAVIKEAAPVEDVPVNDGPVEEEENVYVKPQNKDADRKAKKAKPVKTSEADKSEADVPESDAPVENEEPVFDNAPVIEETENEDDGLPLPLKICLAVGSALAAGGGGFLIWKKKR